MRDTTKNRAAVEAVVSQIAGRLGGGYSLDPDYIRETSDVLLTECRSIAVLHDVARDLRQFDRLPYAREIEALARRNTPGITNKFYEWCERGCDEGYLRVECEVDGQVYSCVRSCDCRIAITGDRDGQTN